jgi:hypothetical protein
LELELKCLEQVTPSNKEILTWSSVQALIHALKIAATYDAEQDQYIRHIHPHQLALKPGACIILIKNLNNIEHGHCNDRHCIIKELIPILIKAENLSGGPHLEILIPQIPMISQDSEPFKRLQFPVLLAYYLTLNGFTFQRVYSFIGICMLVVQGVGTPTICLWMPIKVNLTR